MTAVLGGSFFAGAWLLAGGGPSRAAGPLDAGAPPRAAAALVPGAPWPAADPLDAGPPLRAAAALVPGAPWVATGPWALGAPWLAADPLDGGPPLRAAAAFVPGAPWVATGPWALGAPPGLGSPVPGGAPLLAGVLLLLGILLWPGGGARAGPRGHSKRAWRRWASWRPRAAARLRLLRRRGTGDSRALEVIEALATQVRAGASPDAAWRQAQAVVCRPVGEPAIAGGRVAGGSAAVDGGGAGLADAGILGAVPGADGIAAEGGRLAQDPAWRALGAAWRMSEQTGAPLAEVLDRLAVGLRQEAEVDAEVEASLAAPRATARLLAGLPLVGIALGELIGARPVAVLLGTPVGRVCGLCGVLLAVAGQRWTRRLVDRVARSARAG